MQQTFRRHQKKKKISGRMKLMSRNSSSVKSSSLVRRAVKCPPISGRFSSKTSLDFLGVISTKRSRPNLINQLRAQDLVCSVRRQQSVGGRVRGPCGLMNAGPTRRLAAWGSMKRTLLPLPRLSLSLLFDWSIELYATGRCR